MIVLEAMVVLYVSLVQAGRRTIESLPEAYRQPVTERLTTR